LKILFFDIESSALVTRSWSMWDDRPIKMVKDWELLSFAHKFKGRRRVHIAARSDFKNQAEKPLVQALWNALNSADIVVGHNARRFDIRKAYAKFIEHGLPPPKPFEVVDTLTVARRYFAFTSNKLNDLAKILGVGGKVETGGFKLWEACEAGDKKAWKLMKRYNKRDVILLEKVYEKLLPYMTNHPQEEAPKKPGECGHCGSVRLKAQGYRYVKTGIYRRFRCLDCQEFSRTETKPYNAPKVVAA